MELYLDQPNTQTRWASFENPIAGKGTGATRNRGHKGAPFSPIPVGATVTLVDTAGSGVIRRIWMTINDRSPKMLRSLRLECFWDGAKTPAVSAPLADFFSIGLGRLAVFESELFASPEGRSFCSFVPMPFRNHARITLTNDSRESLSHLFYDVNLTLEPVVPTALYFHAHFRREAPTILGRDFNILPRVTGKGRFLGSCISVIADPIYDGTWWGEGEAKCFLDGDDAHPSLVGTGAEDYISTGWGLKKFAQRYHGCLVDDGDNRQWSFYRFHIPDPIHFHTDCRVILEQVGGAPRDKVFEAFQRKAPMQIISTDTNGHFVPLLEGASVPPIDKIPKDRWINFLRTDDVSAIAYFYLDAPENGLPAIPSVEQRTASLIASNDSRRSDT